MQGLEADFLSQVSAGIRSNPYPSEAGRELVVRLLEREAPARDVGDALFGAYAGGWLLRLRRELGGEAIRGAWHDVSRVLQPFGESPGDEGRESGDILEIHCRSDVLARDSHDAFSGGLGLIELGLRKRGYFGFSMSFYDMEGALNAPRMSFRLVPPTLLEAQLARYFGRDAGRLCVAAGAVPPATVSRLHQAGCHPIGMPMEACLVHDFHAEPLGFALHDEGHPAYWSAHILPAVRIGASLLYDSLAELLPQSLLEKVDDEASTLLDLGFDVKSGGVPRVLRNLEGKLDRTLMEGVRRLFHRKLETVRRELGEDMNLALFDPSAVV